MYRGETAFLICSILTLGMFCGIVEAGPVKRPSRMVREVYPEIEPENEGNQAQVCIVGDVVYGMDEAVPAEQPCLKCKCQAPGVQCETIQCLKRPGCKAIHKPNKCCPDYQCECEHSGKFYANGEKLETSPGGECKVCYCRGGEVQCAEVSCYIRKDCEGKRVPGTCCPRYDHCPPIDPSPNRSPYTTEIIISNPNKDELEPWLITGLSSNSTEGIFNPTAGDFQDENKIPDTNYYEVTTPSTKSLYTDEYQNDAAVLPRITIQEIIPEQKEIPITAPPKVESEARGTLIIEEAEAIDSANDIVVTDTDVESSEISEVFHQPPPVLRVGDKLLFLNKGEFLHENESSTPNSVITIIGAEGLQRGFEESGEIHEIKIGKIENITTEAPDNFTDTVQPLENSKELNELLLNTAASTHILSLVKRKNQPVRTTNTPSLTTESVVYSSTEKVDSEETTTPTSNQQAMGEVVLASSTEVTESINTNDTSELKILDLTTQRIKQNNVTTDEITTDQNPEYPPISEILSHDMDDTSQRFDIDANEKEKVTAVANSKILPAILEIRSNKTVPPNTSNTDWLKINQGTLINKDAALPEALLREPVSSDNDDNSNDHSTEVSSTTEAEPELTTVEEISNITETGEEPVRSIEVIENLSNESGENITPQNKNAAVITDENASIEKEESSEANDMVSEKESDENNKSGETVTPDNVFIDHIDESKKNQTTVKIDDVELINTSDLQKQKPAIEKTVVSTALPELLPQPEKLVDMPLKIIKRDTLSEDESDEIFKDLKMEIDNEQTEKSVNSEEEQRESDAIFRELLEDTSTLKPHTERSEPNKEREALDRVSNAFAQLALRGTAPDASILGILSNFFNSQDKQLE